MAGESFSPNDVMPSWVEHIDGVDVVVHHGIDFSKLTFPDGTFSLHFDDGRVTTCSSDGSLDVIDPQAEHYAHHSAEELDIDAIGLEVVLRAGQPFPKDELEQ